MNTVLVVDDDKEIVDAIEIYLKNEGIGVIKAYDGIQAIQALMENEIHLILMDIMMPKMDGLRTTMRIREEKNIPIILISAKSEDTDKVLGLNMGADDYVTKPFNILEIKARIKAIIRRTKGRKQEQPAERTIVSGDMRIDLDSRRVFIGEREVNLTAKEFDLLELLITNPNKVFNRENLLNLVWGYDYPGDVRTVDVHVRRLREKIEASPSEPKYIHTKWGVGYFFQK